jgi:hypothetical protein
MGKFKKIYGQQANCSGIYQRDFLSLIREFSGGKLQQKGFFNNVIPAALPKVHVAPSLYDILITSKTMAASIPQGEGGGGEDDRPWKLN